MELLFSGKSGMRNIIDTVESLKRKSQKQRGATDDYNLTLQSHLYEISHYKKQIDACQEFKTPELDKVIEKATEIGTESLGLSRLAELSKGISEQGSDFTSSFTFMEQTLQERKDFSDKLEQAEKTKLAKLEEFKKKEQLLNDFPKILASLEEATQPIQDYLSVKTTQSQTEQIALARLP